MNITCIKKAYRYFCSEQVKDVFYHEADKDNENCIIKAKVTPSQVVNNKAYYVWLVMNKKTKETYQTGKQFWGTVHAQLDCLDPVTTLLFIFKMDHAVTGLNRPTSTINHINGMCQTKRPRSKLVRLVISFKKKSHYTKLSCDMKKEAEKTTQIQKLTPLTKQQEVTINNGKKIRMDLHKLMKEDMPNSCVLQLKDKK